MVWDHRRSRQAPLQGAGSLALWSQPQDGQRQVGVSSFLVLDSRTQTFLDTTTGSWVTSGFLVGGAGGQPI